MENRAVIITRATEYAIRAVLYMACQPQGEIVLKKDICRVQEITPAFLTKILQPLIKAGIVGSQRGVGGGFFLAKTPADITLFDIVKTQGRAPLPEPVPDQGGELRPRILLPGPWCLARNP